MEVTIVPRDTVAKLNRSKFALEAQGQKTFKKTSDIYIHDYNTASISQDLFPTEKPWLQIGIDVLAAIELLA
jgi:hypothetical protein